MFPQSNDLPFQSQRGSMISPKPKRLTKGNQFNKSILDQLMNGRDSRGAPKLQDEKLRSNLVQMFIDETEQSPKQTNNMNKSSNYRMPVISQKTNKVNGRNQHYGRHTIGVQNNNSKGAAIMTRHSNNNNHNNSINDSTSNLTFNGGAMMAAIESANSRRDGSKEPSRKRFNLDMVENLNMSWDSDQQD